jgi:hypothetical protein
MGRSSVIDSIKTYSRSTGRDVARPAAALARFVTWLDALTAEGVAEGSVNSAIRAAENVIAVNCTLELLCAEKDQRATEVIEEAIGAIGDRIIALEPHLRKRVEKVTTEAIRLGWLGSEDRAH